MRRHRTDLANVDPQRLRLWQFRDQFNWNIFAIDSPPLRHLLWKGSLDYRTICGRRYPATCSRFERWMIYTVKRNQSLAYVLAEKAELNSVQTRWLTLSEQQRYQTQRIDPTERLHSSTDGQYNSWRAHTPTTRARANRSAARKCTKERKMRLPEDIWQMIEYVADCQQAWHAAVFQLVVYAINWKEGSVFASFLTTAAVNRERG